MSNYVLTAATLDSTCKWEWMCDDTNAQTAVQCQLSRKVLWNISCNYLIRILILNKSVAIQYNTKNAPNIQRSQRECIVPLLSLLLTKGNARMIDAYVWLSESLSEAHMRMCTNCFKIPELVEVPITLIKDKTCPITFSWLSNTRTLVSVKLAAWLQTEATDDWHYEALTEVR